VYEDKELTCSECRESFTYTAAEQEFYASVGFAEGPTRCPDCRGVQDPDNPADDNGGFASEYAEAKKEQLFAAQCVRCGAATRVPARMVFGDGTIYCADCIANEYGDGPAPAGGVRDAW
jgi:hypothetical protein